MKNNLVLENEIKEAIRLKDVKFLKELFANHQIVDMVVPVEHLDGEESLFLFKVLPNDVSGQIFTYMNNAHQQKLITEFSGTQLQQLLENVYSDDIADLVGDLPANLAKKVIQNATNETRSQINLLLSFPEDSAGSIMSCDYFELKENDTVKDALVKLKKQGNLAETINTCYVIDDFRKLVGSISLKNFLFEKKDVLLKDIMETDPLSVTTSTDQEQVATLIKRYDITVIPVVNNESRLIGIVTVDDIMDVMEDEVTEDIQRMNAVRPVETSYLKASVSSLVKSRLPWLLILMITDTFNGLIIANYETALMAIPALTGFMPTIMGTAGNGGGQASTMVIRGIAVDDIHTKDIFKVMFKEVMIGLMCSAVIFAICFLKIYLFPSSLVVAAGTLKVALSVSLAMIFAMMLGKVVGGVLPLLVSMLHLDPASVAAPVITTIADTSALIIYFEIATVFFKL